MRTKSFLSGVILLLWLLACFTHVCAQTCNTIFQQSYGGTGHDEGHAVIYASGGQLVVVGKSTSGSAGGYDGLLMKTDDKGNLLWNTVLGGIKDDALLQVKQTADGGFISIGQTRSAANDQGDIWVVKTDAGGGVIWSRYYRTPAMESVVGKDIIELSTGGYALVANINDSTARGDGLVARLDAAGAPVWMWRFDKGEEDGFHNLAESNGMLVVTGYATFANKKNAVVMKLNIGSGAITWAQFFSWHNNWPEEAFSVTNIPGGITWAIKSTQPATDGLLELVTVKMDVAGNLYFVRNTKMQSTGPNPIRNMVVKPVADSGFIYAFDDISRWAFPTLGKIDAEGAKEWTRCYTDYYSDYSFSGLDLTGNSGYVGVGHLNNALSGFSNKVFLVKTDRMGLTGSCSPYSYGDATGGHEQLQGKDLTWTSVQPVIPANAPYAAQVNNTAFSSSNICKADYCEPPPPVSNGDECTTSFFTDIKDQLNVDEHDLVRTADGDVVVVGYRRFNYIDRAQVIKIKPDGTVRWARQLNSQVRPDVDAYASFSKVINTADNNLLVVGYENEIIDHGSAYYGLIYKMDYNGNILWAKRIAHWYGMKIMNVSLTEDGGFILTVNEDYGFPPIGAYVIRMDASGNIVWQKELKLHGGEVFRSMLYEQGSIYIGMDFYNYGQNHTSVSKLDGQTGDIAWTKHFVKDDELRTTILGIERIKDTVFVGMGLQKDPTVFNYIFNVSVLKLQENTGRQLSGFRVNTPVMSNSTDIVFGGTGDRTTSFFVKTADSSLAFMHECKVNTDTSVQIIKFSGDGRISWARKYPDLRKHSVHSVKSDGAGFLITGARQNTNFIKEENRSAFLLRVNNNGQVEGDAATGNCANIAVTTTTSPVTFKEDLPVLDSVGAPAEHDIMTTVRQLVFLNSPTLAYPSCSTPALCNTVTLTGDNKFCGLNQVALYTAQKNTGCNMPVIWEVDTAAVTILGTTATTLKVKFKKYGSTAVSAALDAGCKTIRSAVNVAVNRAAAELQLGADSTLCPGAVYKADAGSGFEKYLWQDGSTAQTYNVTTPGVYSVTVTDKCSNTTTDQISITPAPVYDFSLGTDIEKCKETAVTLTMPAGFSNYSWNTDFNRTVQDGKVTLFPDQDTAYILTAEKGAGCIYKDTLLVSIITPRPIGLGIDQAVCEGDSLQLAVQGAFTGISWSTRQTGPSIFVKAPGNYSVRAKDDQQCISADTMVLLSPLPLPVLSLPHDPYICINTTRTLDAGSAGTGYLWSTGETGSSITVNAPGKWWVKVTGANGCTATDTAWIKELAQLPLDFLPADTPVCRMGKLDLFPVKDYTSYSWSTGAISRQITVETPGLYWLQVIDNNGCTGRDTVQVGQKECLKGLYMPNAFSPNGDGTNDVLRPLLMGHVLKYKFAVYDRWGRIVFQSAELQKGWDGTLKDRKVETGGYVWICEYQLQGEEPKVEKGSVLVVR